MRKHTWPIFTTVLCMSVSFFVGYTLPRGSSTLSQGSDSEAIHQSGYTFINPLLECETKTIGNNQKYIPFEKKLTTEIERIIHNNPELTTAVYFRNLKNGPWFGINENIDFSPASLMKLPLLIMYLRWSELEPGLLKDKLIVRVGDGLSQAYEVQERIQSGTSYSVDTLLEHLIKFSDNSASNTIVNNVRPDIERKVYQDLGLPAPESIDYVVSVKEYASFFRVLYNASYLSRENSEKALSLLSESTFTGGITGKLPRDIKVAHKYGERELHDPVDDSVINQLHDCGIVYYEKYPYLVCIMTRGKVPMETLSEEIQNISESIFKEIYNIYK